MGAHCCKPPEPELSDTVPVPINLQNDNLWKKAVEMQGWALKFTNGEMLQICQTRPDLMQTLHNDSTALNQIMTQVEEQKRLVQTAWSARKWNEVQSIEYEFKLLYVKAQDIHTKYTGPTAGAMQTPMQTQPVNPQLGMQPQAGVMPQAGGMGMQPPQSMEGEQNHAMPGNTMVPGVGAAAGAPNAYQQQPMANGMQQQQPMQNGYAPQIGNPMANQPMQPQIGVPPVHNLPPQQPQQPPVQQPVQQAPLQLEKGMEKAARVFKMTKVEAQAKSCLRQEGIENRFDEMVAILDNNRAAYEAAKAKREAEEAAAGAPIAAPPPRGPPTGAPQSLPPAGPAGVPPRGPPNGPPAGAPHRAPAPMNLQQQLAAKRNQLHNANQADHSKQQLQMPGRSLTDQKSMRSRVMDNLKANRDLVAATTNNFFDDDEEVSD